MPATGRRAPRNSMYFSGQMTLVQAPLEPRSAGRAGTGLAMRLVSSCRAPKGQSQPQIGAAAPEQQRCRHREPQDEDQRVHQERASQEKPVGQRGVGEGHDVDDRQAGRSSIQPSQTQGEGQKGDAEPEGQARSWRVNWTWKKKAPVRTSEHGERSGRKRPFCF